MKRRDFLLQHVKPGKFLDVGNLDKRANLHLELTRELNSSDMYGLDVLDQRTLGIDLKNQYKGTFEKTSFSDDFFDTVYLGQVLEHTWYPFDVLVEMHRILKSGGRIIIDLPNVYSLSRILRFLISNKEDMLGNSDHKIFYSPLMIQNILEKVGFKKISVKTESSFSIKGKVLSLPNFMSFKYLGECVMAVAEK